MKLSLCLATYNEENNIHYPLDSCINFVDEVIVVDGHSTDKTVEIARSYGKKVKIFNEENPKMFHINKQKALDYATGNWILQLDADEEVSPELAKEIVKVIKMSEKELEEYQNNLPQRELFLRNEQMINSKIKNFKLKIENSQEFTGYYLPRLNYFLGKFLRYGGQYPDGSIRLIKKGKAHFPCKDVHEVMSVDGQVGWLQNPLMHYDSPTFSRYIARNNRYIDMMVKEFQRDKLQKNIVIMLDYCIVKPLMWFFGTQILHKGILDGWQGIVFSFFSALRFPRAYIRYLRLNLKSLNVLI